MDDYKGAYFDPYGIYYSSKIFQGVYENNASLTESDKKIKPVACGYFSSNFKKQLSCNERGMLKQHVFDIDELIKEGHIKSKSIWDANMSKCIKEVPGGVCNSDISLLSPYNSINHFYSSKLFFSSTGLFQLNFLFGAKKRVLFSLFAGGHSS